MEKNPDQLKNLPTLPGVYQFKNKDDKILYKVHKKKTQLTGGT